MLGAVRVMRLSMAALIPLSLLVCTQAAKNYTYPDLDFTLQRGDLYLYPDFLSPEETSRCVSSRACCVCGRRHVATAACVKRRNRAR